MLVVSGGFNINFVNNVGIDVGMISLINSKKIHNIITEQVLRNTISNIPITITLIYTFKVF